MTALFSTPKMPEVKEIPVPSRSSSEVQAAADIQRAQMAEMTRASTWLTGGLGVPQSSQNYATTALLGGG